MAQKRGYTDGNSIGMVKSVNGMSIELNGQKQLGAEKPAFSGSKSPGGTHPGREKDCNVPLNK